MGAIRPVLYPAELIGLERLSARVPSVIGKTSNMASAQKLVNSKFQYGTGCVMVQTYKNDLKMGKMELIFIVNRMKLEASG